MEKEQSINEKDVLKLLEKFPELKKKVQVFNNIEKDIRGLILSELYGVSPDAVFTSTEMAKFEGLHRASINKNTICKYEVKKHSGKNIFIYPRSSKKIDQHLKVLKEQVN